MASENTRSRPCRLKGFVARVYAPIWERIKHEQKAEVTISKAKAATLIQGVKKIKTEENVARKLIGRVPWSKLKITQEEISSMGIVKITFELIYDVRF